MWWLIFLFLSTSVAMAQTGASKTTAQLNAEINTLFADNVIGAITPSTLRQVTLDIVASTGVFSTANTWTAPQTFAGIIDTQTINAPAFPGRGINVQLTMLGTVGNQNYNLFNIVSDNTNSGGAAFFNIGLGAQLVTGASMIGSRSAFQCNVNVPVASSNTTSASYIGCNAGASASSSDGGTNTGAGARSSLFGVGLTAFLQSGATNWLNVTGGEVNVGAQAGSSVAYKSGLQIVAHSSDAVTGAQLDAGLALSAQARGGSAPFYGLANYSIAFSDFGGAFPVNTGGTLIGVKQFNGMYSIANGVDLYGDGNLTYTGTSYRGPGFNVYGSGNVAISPLALAGLTADAPLTINDNTANSLVAPVAGTLFHLIGANTTGVRITYDSFGGQNTFTARRANGTIALPSGLLANQTIFTYSVFGYGSTGYSSAGRGSIAFNAAQNWSDTVQPTQVIFQTTSAVASASQANAVTIQPSGGMTIGPLTTSDPGAGNLNLQSIPTTPVGTPLASAATVCIDSAGNLYRKATCP